MGEANPHVALFAGALGDFLLALPTLRLLEDEAGPDVLAVRRPLRDLAALAGCARRIVPLDDRDMAGFLGGGAPPAWWPPGCRVTAWFGATEPAVRARLAARAAAVRWLRVERGVGAVHAALAYASAAGRPLDWTGALDRAALPAPPAVARASGAPLLVVHAGAGAPAKRWHAAGHAAVVRWWRSRGGAAAELRGEVELEEGPPPIPGAETVEGGTLGEVARVLAGARAFVGHDTGPSHLAAALGVPGVVLFGPTDPARWRPLSEALRVVRAPRAACRRDGFAEPSAVRVVALLEALQP